jgi:putative two-component system response regulator
VALEEAQAAELLIVDDDDPLRRWAERVLHDGGYMCDGACSAVEARERLGHGSYSLVLLDVRMPGESGIELLDHIRSRFPTTAVVMVTGEDDPPLAMSAIENGAYGYLVKPVRAGELLINVANALHRQRSELDRDQLIAKLENAVQSGTDRLEDALQDLRLSENQVWVSQAETILRLARLVEFRDEETGHHIQRMSCYCEMLAVLLELPEQDRERLRLASQLHDVGKVAIPDGILRKHGKLTPSEREVIETHAEIGYEMLTGSTSDVVQVGATIALSHHERWDGGGYPRGLAGEAIPPEGRIAAIADVFDALTSDRVYRAAFPVGLAIDTMRADRGRHFDPEMFDTFMDALPEVEAIRRAYRD